MSLIIAVLTLATAAYMTSCSLTTAFAILVGTTFLIPGTLLVPGVANSFVTIHHVLLIAMTVNVVLQLRKGTLDIDTLKPTAVHFMLFAFIGAAMVIGVIFGDPSVPITVALFSWIFILDQLLIFVIAVVVIRHTKDPLGFAKIVVAGVVAAALVTLYERVTHNSYAAWWFNHTGQEGSGLNFALEVRDGHERVRGAADFALAWGWIAACALPLVVVVATRARRWFWWFALPAVIGMSIIFTHSRSSYGGAVIVGGLLALGSRLDRRVIAVTVLGGLAAGGIFLTSSSVKSTFEGGSAQSSTDTRLKRLPLVLRDVADRPILGLGIASASSRHGLQSTDAAYLGTYADIGVAGGSLFLLLLAVIVVAMLPVLRAPPGTNQLLGVAALAGFVGVIIGAAAFDSFSVSAAFRLAFLLVALGVTIAEPYRLPQRRFATRWAMRAILPLVGAFVGIVIFTVAPRSATVTVHLDAIGPGADVGLVADPTFIGETMTETSCEAMETEALYFPHTTVLCADLGLGNGAGEMRVHAQTLKEAETVTASLIRAGLRANRAFEATVIKREAYVRETWTRTAPVWMATVGLAIAMLPRLPTRRRFQALSEQDRAAIGLSSVHAGS